MLALEIGGLTAPSSPKKRLTNSPLLQLPKGSPGRCLSPKVGRTYAARSSVPTKNAYNLCLSEMRHYRDDGKMVLVMSQQQGDVQEAEYPIPLSEDTAAILDADDDDVLASYAEAAAKLIRPTPTNSRNTINHSLPQQLYKYDDVTHEEFDRETYAADDEYHFREHSSKESPGQLNHADQIPGLLSELDSKGDEGNRHLNTNKSGYQTSKNLAETPGIVKPVAPHPQATIRVHNGARPSDFIHEAPEPKPRGFFDANPTSPQEQSSIYSPDITPGILSEKIDRHVPETYQPPAERGQPAPERHADDDLDDGNVSASFARAVSHSTFSSALPGHSRDRSGYPGRRRLQRDAPLLAQIARIDTNSLSSYSVPTLRKMAKNMGLCNLHGLSKSELVVQLVSEVVLANMSLGLDVPEIDQGMLSGRYVDTDEPLEEEVSSNGKTRPAASASSEVRLNHVQEDINQVHGKEKGAYSDSSAGEHAVHTSTPAASPSLEEFNIDSDFESLSKLTMSELQQLCEDAGIRNWARMRKFEIISALLVSAYEL